MDTTIGKKRKIKEEAEEDESKEEVKKKLKLQESSEGKSLI